MSRISAKWKPYLLPVAAIFLAVLLVFQIVYAARQHNGVDGVLRVEAKPSRSEFLLSEVQPKSAEDAVRVQEYSLINEFGNSLEVQIESASCGCLGFSVNGQRVNRGEPWTIPAKGSVSLELVIPLKNSEGSYSMAFVVAARTEKSDNVVFRRQLSTRTAIVRDVVCVPPAVHFTPAENGHSSDIATVRVENYRLKEPSSTLPRVSIDKDDGTGAAFRIESVRKSGQPEHLATGLVKTTYLVTVRPIPTSHFPLAASSASGRTAMRIRFLSENDALDVVETVPLLYSTEETLR